jgi:hypothetical protein
VFVFGFEFAFAVAFALPAFTGCPLIPSTP